MTKTQSDALDRVTHKQVERLAAIHRAINEIGDPCSVAHGSPTGLVDMGLIEDVQVSADGRARIAVRLTSPSCFVVGYFKEEIQKRVGALPNISSVEVTADLGLDWDPSMMSETAKKRRYQALARHGIVPLVGMSTGVATSPDGG